MQKRKKTILYLLVLFSLGANAQEIIHPITADAAASTAYKVFVNGRPVFVYQSPVPASYCNFEMTGPVTVEIHAPQNIKWVDVRPQFLKITPAINDTVIKFTLQQPCKLSVELNKKLHHPLFLFANAPEKEKPNKNNADVLFFEAGKIHYPGIINLNSNQTVYIEGGAVVVGVIKAKDAKNISVKGYGILDGTYNNRFQDSLIRLKEISKLGTSPNKHRQRSVQFINCKNVKVEGITLHNSTSWQIVPEDCNGVLIKNIKIISDNPSDDGIDVVHSKNVVIQDCFIRTKDDCIAVKAYKKKTSSPGIDSVLVLGPATFEKYSTANVKDVDSITVRNCVFWNALWGNAFEIGFELNGADVKNIVVENCDVIHVEAGAVLSIHNGGVSTVKNVLFQNIRIEDARQKLFDVAIFRARYSPDGTNDSAEISKQYLHGAWDGVLKVPEGKRTYHAAFRGHIQNISFSNIQITDGILPFSIFNGFDEQHIVKNIVLKNIIVRGKRLLSLQEAKIFSQYSSNISIQ